jgi:hypothetical protein
MKNFIFLSLFILIITQSLAVKQVSAVSTPVFPVCTNPQGTLKVKYDSGIHGIVGSSAEYRGSDSVYTVDDDQLMQCFCPDNGTGIQTNWLKAQNFTETDIAILKSQGWIYIPNGALWGLENTSYVAKNIEYSCHNTGGSVGGTTTSSTSPVKDILSAATTTVSHLALTGNAAQLYSLFGMGTFSVILGYFLRKLN